MGDGYGKLGVSAGIARFDAREYGKVGAEYTLRGDFSNPDIGYKLGAKANALIGNGNGVNASTYAGLVFDNMSCTQYNVGLVADYTQAFKKDSQRLAEVGEMLPVDIDAHKSLKAGAEVGFTRNLCCDEDRRLEVSVLGGAEFHPDFETDIPNNRLQYSNKFDKISPFFGAKAEFAKKINSKGNELFFNGACNISDKASTYGELGIGFRF